MLTESQKDIIWDVAVKNCHGAQNLPESVKSVKEAYLSLYDPAAAQREEIILQAAQQLSQLDK